MGCDIHTHIEVRVKGVWKHYLTPEYKKEFYIGRNYDLFGLLAGVRRDVIIKIKDPAGLPADMSSEVAQAYSEMEADAHTPTYYTVDELLAFDWSTLGDTSVFVGVRGWLEHCAGLVPSNGKSLVSRRSASELQESGMHKLVHGLLDEKPGVEYVTKLTVPYSYSDRLHGFVQDYIPRLEKLGDPVDVRMVLWFDD